MDETNKLEIVLPEEFDLYKVEENKSPDGEDGWGIYLYYDGSDPSKRELIFGLNKNNGGDSKAFLDYWCLRLNRAFVQGWSFARGHNVCYPSEGYYEQLNQLYEKWTQQKLKKD